ncbi:MAG: hypothetical protein HN962_05390 [Actinobacteria bacterium]|nr:hypothetical protein [Actinomycetota bacterium]
MVVKITQDSIREIIPDFAKAIKANNRANQKPGTTVIDFRDELKKGYERDVVSVKSELLRFRKENGRLSAEVSSYQQLKEPLNDGDEKSQDTLRKFLKASDPNKTEELKTLIEHKGQQVPAIITADGFLINGNRRKMAIDELYKKTQSEEFLWMKVVILPGEEGDETGGPPTIKEIAQIEHRYQIQSEGKSEYSSFNRALTMRNNRDNFGISLIEQLKDDPLHFNKKERQLKGAETQLKNKYIGPLDCIDEYLDYLGRPRLYNSISSGKEGRWEAFVEYYKIHEIISDQKRREKVGIEEKYVGKISAACFDIIRKQEFKGLPSLNLIIRDVKSSLTKKHHDQAIEELVKLVDDNIDLSPEELKDKEGKDLEFDEIDKLWANKNNKIINQHVHLNLKFGGEENIREGGLDLLEKSLGHLNNEDMEDAIDHMRHEDMGEAIKVANEIARTIKDIVNNLVKLKGDKQKVLNVITKNK